MFISTGNFDSIFFLGITPFLNLEIWPKWMILPTQFVSATPLKPLNRISWNFVVIKDIMCRCAYPQEILIQILKTLNGRRIKFLLLYVKWKMLIHYVYPLQPIFNYGLLPDWPIPPFVMVVCIMCSMLKQCWSSGFLSLLTFSFIFQVFSKLQLWEWNFLQLVRRLHLKKKRFDFQVFKFCNASEHCFHSLLILWWKMANVPVKVR